jgi:copper chaperone CopZ
MRNRNLVIDWNAIMKMLPSNTILGMQISLPLLASSCCLIQLAVNVIAGGCVGFNTYLGPIRPFFVSLLTYLTIIRYNNTRLQTHLIRWIISLLPEIVSIYNTLTTAQISTSTSPSSSVPTISGGDSVMLVENNESLSDDVTYNKVTAKFTIPTMGCVACINKINSAIRSVTAGSDRIIQSSSQLNDNDTKGGEAIVEFICVSDSEHDTIIQEIQNSISNAGFGKNLSLQSSTYRANTTTAQQSQQQEQQQ